MIPLKAAFLAVLAVPAAGAAYHTIEQHPSPVIFDAGTGLMASLTPQPHSTRLYCPKAPEAYLSADALLRLHDSLQYIRTYLEDHDLRDPFLIEHYLGEKEIYDEASWELIEGYSLGFVYDEVYRSGTEGLTYLALDPVNIVNVAESYLRQVAAVEALISDEALQDLQTSLEEHLHIVNRIAGGQIVELAAKKEYACILPYTPA